MTESVDTSMFSPPLDEREEETAGKPPYPPYNCAVPWIKKFLELPRRMKITEVNRDFISQYVVAHNHESKVLNAIKYLQLVDSSGRANEKLALLNSEGDQWKTGLAKIVNEAYSTLLGTINLEKAKPEDISAFFASGSGRPNT